MDNPKRIAIHMYTEKKPKEEKEEEEKGEEKGNAEIEKSVFPFCWYLHFKLNRSGDTQVKITRSAHDWGFEVES